MPAVLILVIVILVNGLFEYSESRTRKQIVLFSFNNQINATILSLKKDEKVPVNVVILIKQFKQNLEKQLNSLTMNSYLRSWIIIIGWVVSLFIFVVLKESLNYLSLITLHLSLFLLFVHGISMSSNPIELKYKIKKMKRQTELVLAKLDQQTEEKPADRSELVSHFIDEKWETNASWTEMVNFKSYYQVLLNNHSFVWNKVYGVQNPEILLVYLILKNKEQYSDEVVQYIKDILTSKVKLKNINIRKQTWWRRTESWYLKNIYD
ncbi:hypothetical protein [Mycoplasma sp. Ms02]|uniref:hypothetical protein n=1 Tax=Mycoplasma sp. Ms02 TaxID=353851 RepID=UPI001C8AFDC2|nr:hypothetical protein [Mycoplasma sp. Ms02]QZE12071.1 hypothetical protein K4L35_01785 [Mycoplasma sp. Ms02]